MRMPVESGRRVTDAITLLLDEWRASGIPGVVLRGYAGLPGEVSNDLDILIDRRRQREFEQVLMTATAACGLKRFARIVRTAGSPVAHRFFDPESGHSFGVDVFVDLNWKGIAFLDGDSVLSDRARGSRFDTPRPAHEAAASLFSKVLHGAWVREDRRRRIRDLARADAAEFSRVVDWAFGVDAGRDLCARVESLELQPDANETRRLRSALLRRAARTTPLRALAGLGRNAVRSVERVRRPTGLFIVLIGPDGSGKSSLSKPLADRLARRLGGVSGFTFHWKPLQIVTGQSGGPVTAPHALPARSRGRSAIFVAYHLAGFMLGYWTSISPRRARGMPVVGERYLFDMWLDPKRYRLELATRLRERAIRSRIFAPDMTFCLLADAGTLQERKQEVSFESTSEQLEAIVKFVLSADSVRPVDASDPPNVVLDACERMALDWLAERDALRTARSSRGRP